MRERSWSEDHELEEDALAGRSVGGLTLSRKLRTTGANAMRCQWWVVVHCNLGIRGRSLFSSGDLPADD